MWILLAAVVSAAPFETKYASTPFGEVAYWDSGEGERALLLLHGLPTSKELWREVAPTLAEEYRVIVPDLPNFGDSARTSAGLVHRERAEAIDALLDALAIDRFVLVAHDLGASVAVDYMGLHGEKVDALVLMSSPVYPDFEEPGVVELLRRPVLGTVLIGLAPRTLYRVSMKMGLHHDEQLSQQDVRDYARFYTRDGGRAALRMNLWWGTPEVMFAPYPAILRDIQVPTLLIHGEQDPFIPIEHAHRLERDVPDAELLLIAGGGHFLPIDVPEQVAEAVSAFLSEAEPAATEAP